ncbi:sensory rhodopsin transducer [Polyangium jinanense]|uniref:Sensory rhodopsin transducer n=1 Tax=Polyangium jinanense TaxID=2829994 RepID=A0A9X3XEC3_9BACT|nr:sensory rhodopsin transducer [Polyangium jinanense]MDC3961058.1 sensory rhodopsin transducer [Polyangium jinanense]MDC3987478.1 sensory rhodopsin transducer [Polyangium jinanense]
MSKPAGCKRWSVAEGHVAKRADGDGTNDVLWLLNASAHEAHVEIMVYFEHRVPAGPYRLTLLPERSRRIRWHELEGPEPLPIGTDFATVIESDVPIVVQYTRVGAGGAGAMTTIAHWERCGM